MFRKIAFIILAVSIYTCHASTTDPNQADSRIRLALHEGFTIKSIDGTVSYCKETEKWFFAPAEDITDGLGIVEAGTKIQMLESQMLEQIAKIYKEKEITDFRLWATAINFKSKNSLYPIYFLTLKKAAAQDTKEAPKTSDANESNILPEEVLSQLKPKRIVTSDQLTQALQSPEDSVILNRTGFIFYDRDNKRYILKFDSLGQKTENIAFQVHPSKAMARAKKLQRKSPVPMRFKISGRITQFQGRRYILLHKIQPAFSNGNLGR